MEDCRSSLWLSFLFIQLFFHPSNTNENLSTVGSYLHTTEGVVPPTSVHPDISTSMDFIDPYDVSNNVTGADCLIDTQMGLIAVASAGGLIVCLLVSTVALACQICYMQRRAHAPRHSRSNIDLVSSSRYWDTERSESGGLVGPCDSGVILEEVRVGSETERQAALQDAREEDRENAAGTTFDCDDKNMQHSSSRDSCLDVPRDLEDMPLVV